MIFIHILSALISGLQLASALPYIRTADHVNRTTHEYMYRRDSASSCTPLTLDQAQKLPGWSQIVKYAQDTYGSGSLNYVINPKEYPDSPATICSDSSAPVTIQGSPACSETTSDIQGGVAGTSGTVVLTQQQGYTSTGTWSVTQESSLAVGATLSVSVGIPEVAGVSASVTTTATFTNSLSKSFETSVNTMASQSVTLNAANGQKCSASLKTKTCSVNGQGSARFVASGFVWFNYDDKRAPIADPKGGQHFKYSVDIASVIKNIDDRSSDMKFSGSMQVKSMTDFQGSCI
jgi:hypothetical protein